jgi:hypothetical protein
LARAGFCGEGWRVPSWRPLTGMAHSMTQIASPGRPPLLPPRDILMSDRTRPGEGSVRVQGEGSLPPGQAWAEGELQPPAPWFFVLYPPARLSLNCLAGYRLLLPGWAGPPDPRNCDHLLSGSLHPL